MKLSGVFGLSLLLVLIDGFEDVSVICSEYWLQVRIKQSLYLHGQPLQPHELSLGTGCVVTGQLLDFFEFAYPVNFCGIKTESALGAIPNHESFKFIVLDRRSICNGDLVWKDWKYLFHGPFQKKKRPWGILIESSITYQPENLNITGYLPISCYIQKNSSFIFKKKVKGSNDDNESQKSTEEENSTSCQREDSWTQSEVTVGNHFLPVIPHKLYSSQLMVEIKL